MDSIGLDLSGIIDLINAVLSGYELTKELHYYLAGLCGLVVIWHFSSVTIKNLLRGGEGFSFEIYAKPIFYLIMISAWPLLYGFIEDASNGIGEVVAEQQQQVYNANENVYAQIDQKIEKLEKQFDIADAQNYSENEGFFSEIKYTLSSLDKKIALWLIKLSYNIASIFDSFVYVCFYFFTKLWLKITLLGGGIAFTVSLLTGGWTVLINWAKTVLSISLWIPVASLLLTIINSVLLKITQGLTLPVLDITNSPINAMTHITYYLILFTVLLFVFAGFKLIILAKVPSLINSWIGGGSGMGSGFGMSFIPFAVGTSAVRSTVGVATSVATKGASSVAGTMKK